MHSLRRTAWLLSMFLATLGNVSASPLVSVGSGTGLLGNSFTVPVLITGASSLSSWQFDISYDPSLFKVNSVTEGPFLSLFGTTLFTPGVIDDNTGLVSLVANAYVDLPPEPSGSGVLATIEFTALGVGQSAITLSNVFLNLDAQGFDVSNGHATGIPEPAPFTLVPMALAVVALSRQHRNRRHEPI